MRLGAAQISISGNLEVNLQRVAGMMEEAGRREIDLLAFPEMNLTGFDPRLLSSPTLADDLRQALDRIAGLAARLGVGVIVGRPLAAAGKVYNAATVLLPDGRSYTYRKMHLTAEEARYFAQGEEPLLFDLAGHRLGAIICRDQNFPELARAIREAGAQALFILSAHYYPPAEARWKLEKNRALPIARAVENHFPVILANAVGAHIGRVSLGNSLIVDPEGAVVAAADEASETLLACDLV